MQKKVGFANSAHRRLRFEVFTFLESERMEDLLNY